MRRSCLLLFPALFSIVVVSLSAHVAEAVEPVELIVNGGFESGEFSGWTQTANGVSELTPWTVGPAGGGWFRDTAPLEGNSDAYNGFDGGAGLEYELYQDVTIPSGYSASFATNHRIVYDSLGIFSELDRIFEITIRNLDDIVLQTLYSESVTMNGAPRTDLGWNAQMFDVSTFVGSTVRVHFREFIPENFTGPANIELDAISLIATPLIEIDLDIKPGPSNNTVALNGNGTLQMAILANEEFDVLDIDINSLLFGDPILVDGGATPLGATSDKLRDLNHDGLDDLLVGFSISDLVDGGALDVSSVEGRLTGELFDGTPFFGSDIVRMVPQNNGGGGLAISAVPEPSTSLLLLIAFGCSLAIRRRAE